MTLDKKQYQHHFCRWRHYKKFLQWRSAFVLPNICLLFWLSVIMFDPRLIWLVVDYNILGFCARQDKHHWQTSIHILFWSLLEVKVKLKCTLVQALWLCTGCMAHRGSRGIALLFLDHGTRRGWGVSLTPRLLIIPGKDLVPIVQEAGWAPGPVWTGAENLASTGIRSPDHPAHSQSLYRPSYPAYKCVIIRWRIRHQLDVTRY